MSSRSAPINALALKGWRARAWAWVLFLALFKGLIPHAALASVLMTGDPALVWCAPGTASTANEVKAGGGMSASAHSCVCAASADGALPLGGSEPAYAPATRQSPQPLALLSAATPRLLPPPARGPPSL